MRQHGIQIHSQLRAGGIAVNQRPATAATADNVVSAADCTQAYTTCRTSKVKNGMSPPMASKFCKTLLKQCQERVA